MSRIVIVARTRMHSDHVCIGGHDLDCEFRGVRLLDRFGDYWSSDSPFVVGEVWNIRYRAKVGARPPHVEDVCVTDRHRMARVVDLKGLVLKYTRPWAGSPEVLFDGAVRCTPSGTAYISSGGPLPPFSTGYWVPDEANVRDEGTICVHGEGRRQAAHVGGRTGAAGAD
jgi:hypothetical protein